MLTTTTENIPGKKYEIIGTVTANRTWSLLSKTEIDKVLIKLESEARSLGADAIVAIKVFTTANAGTSLIGTAVKFI